MPAHKSNSKTKGSKYQSTSSGSTKNTGEAIQRYETNATDPIQNAIDSMEESEKWFHNSIESLNKKLKKTNPKRFEQITKTLASFRTKEVITKIAEKTQIFFKSKNITDLEVANQSFGSIAEHYEEYAGNYFKFVNIIEEYTKKGNKIELGTAAEDLKIPLRMAIHIRFFLYRIVKAVDKNRDYLEVFKKGLDKLKKVCAYSLSLFQMSDSFNDMCDLEESLDMSKCEYAEKGVSVILQLNLPTRQVSMQPLESSPYIIKTVTFYDHDVKQRRKVPINLVLLTDTLLIVRKENNKEYLLYPPTPLTHLEILSVGQLDFKAHVLQLRLKTTASVQLVTLKPISLDDEKVFISAVDTAKSQLRPPTIQNNVNSKNSMQPVQVSSRSGVLKVKPLEHDEILLSLDGIQPRKYGWIKENVDSTPQPRVEFSVHCKAYVYSKAETTWKACPVGDLTLTSKGYESWLSYIEESTKRALFRADITPYIGYSIPVVSKGCFDIPCLNELGTLAPYRFRIRGQPDQGVAKAQELFDNVKHCVERKTLHTIQSLRDNTCLWLDIPSSDDNRPPTLEIQVANLSVKNGPNMWTSVGPCKVSVRDAILVDDHTRPVVGRLTATSSNGCHQTIVLDSRLNVDNSYVGVDKDGAWGFAISSDAQHVEYKGRMSNGDTNKLSHFVEHLKTQLEKGPEVLKSLEVYKKRVKEDHTFRAAAGDTDSLASSFDNGSTMSADTSDSLASSDDQLTKSEPVKNFGQLFSQQPTYASPSGRNNSNSDSGSGKPQKGRSVSLTKKLSAVKNGIKPPPAKQIDSGISLITFTTPVASTEIIIQPPASNISTSEEKFLSLPYEKLRNLRDMCKDSNDDEEILKLLIEIQNDTNPMKKIDGYGSGDTRFTKEEPKSDQNDDDNNTDTEAEKFTKYQQPAILSSSTYGTKTTTGRNNNNNNNSNNTGSVGISSRSLMTSNRRSTLDRTKDVQSILDARRDKRKDERSIENNNLESTQKENWTTFWTALKIAKSNYERSSKSTLYSKRSSSVSSRTSSSSSSRTSRYRSRGGEHGSQSLEKKDVKGRSSSAPRSLHNPTTANTGNNNSFSGFLGSSTKAIDKKLPPPPKTGIQLGRSGKTGEVTV